MENNDNIQIKDEEKKPGVPLSEKEKRQKIIDSLFNVAYGQYEKIMAIENPHEKNIKMDVFYINYLKPVFDALNYCEGFQTISCERFGRNDGYAGHWYVPVYVDKNGIEKMSKNSYPYKATALLRLLASFTSIAKDDQSNGFKKPQ